MESPDAVVSYSRSFRQYADDTVCHIDVETMYTIYIVYEWVIDLTSARKMLNVP